MAYQLGTPFDSIESAREYVNQLLAATREAQAEIETELGGGVENLGRP